MGGHGRRPGVGIGCPQAGLARLDGRSWEAIRELGGSRLTNATIVGTTQPATCGSFRRPEVTSRRALRERADPIRAARFDGTDWTVVELPDGFMADIALRPTGRCGRACDARIDTGGGDRGPARYDGDGVDVPYDGAGLPWMELAAVAPDGTVFGRNASTSSASRTRPPP